MNRHTPIVFLFFIRTNSPTVSAADFELLNSQEGQAPSKNREVSSCPKSLWFPCVTTYPNWLLSSYFQFISSPSPHIKKHGGELSIPHSTTYLSLLKHVFTALYWKTLFHLSLSQIRRQTAWEDYFIYHCNLGSSTMPDIRLVCNRICWINVWIHNLIIFTFHT